GYSAIALAHKERPNLIILDLGLPAGNGYSVLKRLQESDALSSIPVIVLTARDPLGNEERTLDAGATAFFQKPADNNELLEVIRASLQTASPWGQRSTPYQVLCGHPHRRRDAPVTHMTSEPAGR